MEGGRGCVANILKCLGELTTCRLSVANLIHNGKTLRGVL